MAAAACTTLVATFSLSSRCAGSSTALPRRRDRNSSPTLPWIAARMSCVPASRKRRAVKTDRGILIDGWHCERSGMIQQRHFKGRRCCYGCTVLEDIRRERWNVAPADSSHAGRSKGTMLVCSWSISCANKSERLWLVTL